MARTSRNTAEHTSAVVIGSGFSGLTVANELSRRHIDVVLVDSPEFLSTKALSDMESSDLHQRQELLRVLQRFSQAQNLDIRNKRSNVQITRQHDAQQYDRWLIETSEDQILTQNLILTPSAQHQFQRVVQELHLPAKRSITKEDLLQLARAIGIYLLGLGSSMAPSTQQVMRQAQKISQAIQSQVRANTTAQAQLGVV